VSAFNLDGYLARIGWAGPREPTRETATGVLRAHMRAVPFENLDVLLGLPIRLGLDDVYAKLVTARRGGYCFEHGTLLQAALRGLGFAPAAHTARVILERPRAEAPRTHMFLTLRFESREYVFDPGFGGLAPCAPVPLVEGEEARDGHDRHRMVRQGDEWVLEAILGGTPTPLWMSSLDPAEPVDFVMANHFVSTFPESPFVTRLMLRSIASVGRISALNQNVTIRRDGREERMVLKSRAALRRLLSDHFGFDLPEVERLRVPSVPEWT
jgi:N-hydroxyarylamine O-acetyltransferase